MTNGICQAKSSLPLYVSMNVGMHFSLYILVVDIVPSVERRITDKYMNATVLFM